MYIIFETGSAGSATCNTAGPRARISASLVLLYFLILSDALKYS